MKSVGAMNLIQTRPGHLTMYRRTIQIQMCATQICCQFVVEYIKDLHKYLFFVSFGS